MQQILDKRQEQIEGRELPRLQIAGVELTNDLENLGFFFVGVPGSGKTQGIKDSWSLLLANLITGQLVKANRQNYFCFLLTFINICFLLSVVSSDDTPCLLLC